MTGTITIQVNNSGTFSLQELQNRLERYMARIVSDEQSITPFVATLGVDANIPDDLDIKKEFREHLEMKSV